MEEGLRVESSEASFRAYSSLVLAILLFRINVYGSFLSIFAILFPGVFSFVGLGIVMMSIAGDEETASMIITTLTLPMMFLRGIFFPVEMMPPFMQTISRWLPFTYAVDAMKRIMVFGATLGNVYTDIMVMRLRDSHTHNSHPGL